jgi:hybrid cluster-associated redox disulfide protein
MSQPHETKITESTTVAEVLEYPEAYEILAKYGLPCLHCPMATFEIRELKIGEVSKAYGIDADALIKELNQSIKPQKTGKSGK